MHPYQQFLKMWQRAEPRPQPVPNPVPVNKAPSPGLADVAWLGDGPVVKSRNINF